MKLAISTCPNDTFAFHAILNRKIDLRGLDFEIELLDIEELNQRIVRDEFDIAKGSYHAAILMADKLFVLPSGSALGFGVGPLLLAASPNSSPNTSPNTSPNDLGQEIRTTLCPGELTTATLLYKLFYSESLSQNKTIVEQRLFSDILPALKNGTADFGVCIHEGRFTWQEQGLHLVEDLGTRWETETGQPLPLGGLFARRSLDQEVLFRTQSVIKESILYGLENRNETIATMRRFAQELSDDVLLAHVDLYVNQWTIELGNEGRAGLKALSQLVQSNGVVFNKTDFRFAELEVLEP